MAKKSTAANRGKTAGRTPPEGRRFRKGQSGNPSGRPAGFAEFRQQCREHSNEAMAALISNLGDPEGSVRNKAAETIWAYAWGKPTQAVEVSGPEGEAIKTEAHSVQSPEQLAAVIRILAGAAPLPKSGAARGGDASPDAEAD